MLGMVSTSTAACIQSAIAADQQETICKHHLLDSSRLFCGNGHVSQVLA